MPFKQRFDRAPKCSKCNNPIEKGQYMSWNRTGDRSKYHIDCENPWNNPDDNGTPETPRMPYNGNGNGNPLAEAIASSILPLIEHKISAKADTDELLEYIDAKLEGLVVPLRIEVKAPSGDITRLENTHKMLPKILATVSRDVPVYLFSHLPGTGKSTMGEQIAKALGLPYYTETFSPGTPEWKVFGYGDATGRYIESNFYRAYTQGGVYFVDEYDNGSAALIATLNQALANGHCSFPVVGMVDRHPDFRFIAAGNTPARGANPRFPDRRPQDGAAIDRLAFFEIPVDKDLELALASQYSSKASVWVKWVQGVRSIALQNYPKLIASPRASLNGAKLIEANFTPVELADMLIFKGCDTSTKDAILASCPLPETF